MWSLPLGFISMILVVGYSISSDTISSFMNIHALSLVVGGSIAALALGNPSSVMKQIFISLKDLALTRKEDQLLRAEIVELSKKRNLSNKTHNPLIEYIQELWEQGLNNELVIALLQQRKVDLVQRNHDAVQAFRNLAKYPPALGMIGTVLGLVGMFARLNADDKSLLGPALALALTTTFFGLILSNTFIMPLADRLQIRHQAYKRRMNHVFELLVLICEGEAHVLIEEEAKDRVAS